MSFATSASARRFQRPLPQYQRRPGSFVEVFPDEGDINMIRALKVYKEIGYEYMIMPDHVPGIGGPEPGKVGFAYTFGYIHAALQAVEEL